jgi:hypothetical protein
MRFSGVLKGFNHRTNRQMKEEKWSIIFIEYYQTRIRSSWGIASVFYCFEIVSGMTTFFLLLAIMKLFYAFGNLERRRQVHFLR